MFKNGLNGIIMALSILGIIIWIATVITPVEITVLYLKKLVVFISLAGLTYTLMVQIVLKKYKYLRILFSLLLVLVLGFSIHFYHWEPSWKAYIVHYKNNKFKNRSIETQTQYLGEWRTKDRLVEVIRINKYFCVAQEIDTSKLNSEWIRFTNK